MKNDLIEARLRRDTTLLAFLDEHRAQYADLEDDVKPTRDQISQLLSRAQVLAGEVLTADADHNAPRKAGTRRQLSTLLQRLIVALRAEATATTDARLLGLAGQPGALSRLPESTFGEEARRLLSLVPERKTALVKRRFLPTHYSQAQQLLQELRTSATEGRLNDATGAAGRQGLERIIKETGRHISTLTTLLAVYAPDEPDFWRAYQAAAKVVRRGGGGGDSSQPTS